MTMQETPLLHLTAEDLMSRDVLVIPQHMSLRAPRICWPRPGWAAHTVVDEDGRCVGVLSAADLVQWVDRGSRAAKRRNRTPACVCCDWQMDGLEDVPGGRRVAVHDDRRGHGRPGYALGDVARSMRETPTFIGSSWSTALPAGRRRVDDGCAGGYRPTGVPPGGR